MFANRSDHHEFKPLLTEIEEEPLNPLGRLMLWTISLALLFSVLWLCFGRIDVVVTARGKVIPAGEVKTIQPLTGGVVSKILVKPGQLVEAGAVLMEIDPAGTEHELESLRADRTQRALDILRLEALLAGESFKPPEKDYEKEQLLVQRALFESTRSQLKRQILVKQEELAQISQQVTAERDSFQELGNLLGLAQRKLERLQPVRDLVSRDDYDTAHAEVMNFTHQRALKRHKIEELGSSLEQVQEEIRLLQENQRKEWLNELVARRQEFNFLVAKIEQTEFVNTRQQLRSPVRGFVAELQVHTVGGVVSPGEKLMVVVPADSERVVKAHVMNKDVGYLSPGLDVAIKVDAFEFQRYGTLRGKLVQVSQDSLEDERQGLIYEIMIDLVDTSLLIDEVETSLAAGMSVSAEVKIGKRRLIELFIYPLIKYWQEGTSIR